jgi:hypothetical protein
MAMAAVNPLQHKNLRGNHTHEKPSQPMATHPAKKIRTPPPLQAVTAQATFFHLVGFFAGASKY